MDVQTCKHPACQCQVNQADRFCSPHCEHASQDVARHNTCSCGHRECARKP